MSTTGESIREVVPRMEEHKAGAVGSRVWVWNKDTKPISRKQAMIACVNPGTVDVMFDDGTEADDVDSRNITLIATFPELSSSLTTREVLGLAATHKQKGNDLLRQEAFVEVNNNPTTQPTTN